MHHPIIYNASSDNLLRIVGSFVHRHNMNKCILWNVLSAMKRQLPIIINYSGNYNKYDKLSASIVYMKNFVFMVYYKYGNQRARRLTLFSEGLTLQTKERRALL